MKNWGAKKKVFYCSLLSIVYFFFFNFFRPSMVCFGDRGCVHVLGIIALCLYPIVALALISFLLVFLRDEIFHKWFRFTKWYIPLSIIAILIAPQDTGGYMPIPIQSTIALSTAGVFLAISLIIIGWQLRKEKGGKL